MINYADEIKRAVPARELLEHYGFEINRAGFCRSPFASNDKTPSLKVYDGGRGWHDFSSGKGGDIVDFVREYFNLSFSDAQKKINDDLRLGLKIGKKLSREQQLEFDRKAAERRQKIAMKKKAHNDLLEAYYDALGRWVYLDKLMRENEPQSEEELLAKDEKFEKWAYAAKYITYASYLVDEAQYAINAFKKKTW